jgi:gamma-glutamyltranspeptidase/glutathione hydrolase/leukotriene-C4 hydrolase
MADGREAHLDFREVAPAGATADMYVTNPTGSTLGPISSAVPGELAGLEYAWKNYGSGNVSWTQIVQPSADLARAYQVGPLLAIRIASTVNQILGDPGLASVYAPEGVGKKEGEWISNPKLAETLQRVANEGASVFYASDSTLAQSLVRDIQNNGGIITLQDLHNYYYNNTVREVKPVETFYQGYEVLGAGPPFGGLCVGQTLNILERYNLPLIGPSPQAYHWLTEALAFAFSNRMALGDPAFVNLSNIVPLMLSKEHAGDLRARLRPNATFPYTYYEDLAPLTTPTQDQGTTHISVIDPQRNAVALTSTVNLVFGSKFMSTSTGVIMNNEMDDFSSPNRSNAFNLPPSKANFIAPGKRPLSSMSPTIVVRDGKLFLVTGASGGSRIITATLQVILGVIAFNRGVWEAVSGPRLHHQLLPTSVYTEPGFSASIILALQKIGHKMDNMGEVGVTQAILQLDNGTLNAASDPRKMGVPAGY